jgi:hypothetical protein
VCCAPRQPSLPCAYIFYGCLLPAGNCSDPSIEHASRGADRDDPGLPCMHMLLLQNARNVLVASCSEAPLGVTGKIGDLGLSRSIKAHQTHRTTNTVRAQAGSTLLRLFHSRGTHGGHLRQHPCS